MTAVLASPEQSNQDFEFWERVGQERSGGPTVAMLIVLAAAVVVVAVTVTVITYGVAELAGVAKPNPLVPLAALALVAASVVWRRHARAQAR